MTRIRHHQIFFTFALMLTNCTTSPEGRRQLVVVSPAQMSQMGEQAFEELKRKTPVESNTEINRYVRCVADAVAVHSGQPGQNWEVVVFRDPTANAFALPGGKIGVHSGMLLIAREPQQLAAVLGHEVAHVIARHGAERVSEQMIAQGGLGALGAILGRNETGRSRALMAALGLGFQFGVVLPHSRAQESEADAIGLRLMAEAGFEPRGAVELWQRMAATGGTRQPEFMSTHPGHETRIRALQERLPQVAGTYQSSSKDGAVRCTPPAALRGQLSPSKSSQPISGS